MIIKKSTILLTCILLIIFPLLCNISFSYAEEEENNNSWTYIESQFDEADKKYTVAAIKAYLYLRGYTMDFTYNAQKAIVQWSYNKFDQIAKEAGVSGGLSAMNNKFAYAYDNNGVLKFYYDNTCLYTLNLIYQAILEYYDIDENGSKTIYSGKVYIDSDGNTTYLYSSKIRPPSTDSQFQVQWNTSEELFNSIGTVYLDYNYETIYKNLIDFQPNDYI